MKYIYESNRKLYIEVPSKSGGTEIIEATQKQIDDYRLKYLITEKCDCKLIFDIEGFAYYSRYCGICGNFLDLV